VLLPRVERITGTKLDLPGQGFLMAGIILVLYSASQFAHSLTSPRTVVPSAPRRPAPRAFFVWESRYGGHFYPVGLSARPPSSPPFVCRVHLHLRNRRGFLQVTNLWQYVNGLATARVAGLATAAAAGGHRGGLGDRTAHDQGPDQPDDHPDRRHRVRCGVRYSWRWPTLHSLIGFLPGLVLTGSGVVIAAVPFGSLILAEAPARYLGPVSSSRPRSDSFFLHDRLLVLGPW